MGVFDYSLVGKTNCHITILIVVAALSTIWPHMEYYCYAWLGPTRCYLLLRYIRKTTETFMLRCLSHTCTCAEPLARPRGVAKPSLLYKYYFCRSSYELADLFPLPFSRGISIFYSNRLHYIYATIPRSCQYVYVNGFSLAEQDSKTHSLQNAFYDVNGFKSWVNRQSLSLSSFWSAFVFAFHL